MATQSPYFDDGAVNVELGEAGHGDPQFAREVLRIKLGNRPAAVHGAGGGEQDIRLETGRERENLGDAEKYAYELFTSLATSEHGTLGVRDWRSSDELHEHVWADAICIEASATIEAHKWVSMSLRFLAPQKAPAATTTTSGAWPAPSPPGTYPGTSTSQDYSAGGIDLGVGGSLRIEMVRSADLRTIPRARGAKPGAPWSGSSIRLIVNAHAKTDTEHLAGYLADLTRSIPTGPINLTANGNRYSGLILEELRPDNAIHRSTSFSARFVKEL